MRALIGIVVFLNGVSCEYYTSFSSSTFSSSYTNENGEAHSSSSAEESYAERNSRGLNRHGSGKLLTQDGIQVFEETKNCDGGKCRSTTDTDKQHIGRLSLKSGRL